jgi:hypothetical protein
MLLPGGFNHSLGIFVFSDTIQVFDLEEKHLSMDCNMVHS